MKAPFPWFGGKSKVAHLVWEAFGDTPNYVEPFAGSLAVLLGRPTPARIETVNDLDCYLANFWRAVQADPEAVARHADWPVNEADLHARHHWLVMESAAFREQMKTEPEYFDVKRAGWWVWGLCQWIGTGWCSTPTNKLPLVGGTKGTGVHRQLPNLSGDGGAAGRGIHASGLHRKLPRMDRGTDSRLRGTNAAIREWMDALAQRLRRVRVCCGDWSRIVTYSVTDCIGLTGVFLDPPYEDGNMDYAAGGVGTGVSAEVRAWALANGANPKLRIALCGYEGEHELPGWTCISWKAQGGYSSQENAARERIWFSPHCLSSSRQRQLFAANST